MKSIGMIGCGEIAKLHAACIAETDGLQLKKVFDIEPGAARQFAEKTGSVCCQSVEDILGDWMIDAVYICTRHDTHADLIVAGLDAGKDVFCEKPMAMNLHECEAIKNALDRSGRKLMIGYNMRFAPMTVAFKQLLRQKNFRPDICQAVMATAPFFTSWAGLARQGGGALVCLGSHVFDLLRFLLEDEFSDVLCFQKRIRLQRPYLNNYVRIWAQTEKSTEVEISLHDQAAAGYSFSPCDRVVGLQMHGTGATAELFPYAGYSFYEREAKTISQQAVEKQTRAWGYVAENEAFLKVMEGALCAYPDFFDGLADVKMIELAQQSSDTKQWRKREG